MLLDCVHPVVVWPDIQEQAQPDKPLCLLTVL